MPVDMESEDSAYGSDDDLNALADRDFEQAEAKAERYLANVNDGEEEEFSDDLYGDSATSSGSYTARDVDEDFEDDVFDEVEAAEQALRKQFQNTARSLVGDAIADLNGPANHLAQSRASMVSDEAENSHDSYEPDPFSYSDPNTPRSNASSANAFSVYPSEGLHAPSASPTSSAFGAQDSHRVRNSPITVSREKSSPPSSSRRSSSSSPRSGRSAADLGADLHINVGADGKVEIKHSPSGPVPLDTALFRTSPRSPSPQQQQQHQESPGNDEKLIYAGEGFGDREEKSDDYDDEYQTSSDGEDPGGSVGQGADLNAQDAPAPAQNGGGSVTGPTLVDPKSQTPLFSLGRNMSEVHSYVDSSKHFPGFGMFSVEDDDISLAQVADRLGVDAYALARVNQALFPGLQHDSVLVESMQILVPHEILHPSPDRQATTPPAPGSNARKSSGRKSGGRKTRKASAGTRKSRPVKVRKPSARRRPLPHAELSGAYATASSEDLPNFDTKLGKQRRSHGKAKPNPTMKQLHAMQQAQFKSSIGGMDTSGHPLNNSLRRNGKKEHRSRRRHAESVVESRPTKVRQLLYHTANARKQEAARIAWQNRQMREKIRIQNLRRNKKVKEQRRKEQQQKKLNKKKTKQPPKSHVDAEPSSPIPSPSRASAIIENIRRRGRKAKEQAEAAGQAPATLDSIASGIRKKVSRSKTERVAGGMRARGQAKAGKFGRRQLRKKSTGSLLHKTGESV